MLNRLGHLLLALALLVATGSHWAMLQTVAWSTMLADNLRSRSLTEAVQRTFDGKHPCALCRNIAAAKKSEKKTEFPLQLKRLEFVSVGTVIVFCAPQDFRLLPEFDYPFDSLHHKPPLPPPRDLSA